jgi:ABC-type Fe3+ transport system substrate-binding protein
MTSQSRLSGAVAVLVAAAVGIGVAACGSSDDAASDTASGTSAATSTATSPAGAGDLQQTAAFKKVLAAAEQEGTLNLNWGFSSPDVTKRLTAAFSKRFPRIKVTVTPNQDQPGNTAKLIEETKAGKPSSTDAYVGVPQLLYSAGPGGADVLEKVDWGSIAAWAKGSATSDGVGLAILDQYTSFAYNSGQFTDADLPKTADDVLKLKQPIASTPYAAQFNVLGSPAGMGEQGVKNYVKAYKPAGFIGCGDLSRVASGEFAALWVNCGANITDIFAAKGAPLKNDVIQDAAATYPWYGGVPKSSAHPNAAKLWVVWLDSPEAQKILFQGEKADNARLDGSQTAKQLAGYRAKGVKFIDADYDFVADNQASQSREFSGQLIGLLTKK